METYTRTGGPSWKTHPSALEKIKADVNESQQNMRGLQSHRTIASPWQQDAIDRLNRSKNPTTPPYPEYPKANTRIATDLADEIDATIDYAQNKEKPDSLGQQLDSPAK
jgi:hypothetical protein